MPIHPIGSKLRYMGSGSRSRNLAATRNRTNVATPLEPSKGVLWVAVGLAAWECVSTMKHLLKPHMTHGSAWLAPFYIQIFPKAGVFINVLLELGFICAFLQFVRITNGWARVFVICYGSETLLDQFRALAPSAGKAVQALQVVSALFALGIALRLLTTRNRTERLLEMSHEQP